MVLVLPIAIWEFSFGVYMIVKGFRPAVAADRASAPTISPSLATASA